MENNKQGIWDDLIELGRRIINKIDELLIPESKPTRKPARVPIPVRNNPRKPQQNPYEHD